MAYTNLIESFQTLKLHAMAETFLELSQTAGFNKLTKESLLNFAPDPRTYLSEALKPYFVNYIFF